MNPIGYPLRASLIAREVGGDLIIHDERTGSVHRLNSVAGVIWQLCDGLRDRDAIAAELGALFEMQPADVASDVENILVRFTDNQLIEWRTEPSGNQVEGSPE